MRSLPLLAGLVILLSGCDGLPELTVEHAPNSVTVHLGTLGEYPTSVSRVRLEDSLSGRVVWQIRSRGTTQIWELRFRTGPNAPSPAGVTGSGFFEVLTPAGSSSFALETGRPYRLSVWSETGRVQRIAEFAIEPATGH